MKYSLRLSDDRMYVIIKTSGDITREEAYESNIRIHAFGRGHGVNRYLQDVTESRNVDSVSGNYEFAHKDMKRPDVDQTARVALLVAPGDPSHDFVEVVSANAGLNVRLFTDREAAVRFLLG